MRSLKVSSFLFFIVLLIPTFSVTHARSSLPDIVSVVEKSSAAVVNISTTQKIKRKRFGGHEMPDMPEGTPFDDFFKRFFGDEGGGLDEYDSKSLGSGFIISSDGYLLTNNHVIQDADEIVVRLSDRRELTAEVIGTDERSDVALLKIEAEGLPVAVIGDSNKLKVGEWVVAIGSPFDFDHTVTAGIVSALSRSLPSENYVPFIQTDVAINPGNSGGPLLNLKGEVVGVNAQIYSRTGGFMGLSFTIPIDLAMSVADQLKSKGHVSRGWLGVFIQDVTRELAESFDMDKPEGALVSQVIEGSPAAEAGFKVGDIVLEFNGKPVINSSALPPMVGVTGVGNEVDVLVLREGERVVLPTVIAELPQDDDVAAAATGKSSKKPSEVNRLNVSVQNIADDVKEEYELANNDGVLITKVNSGPAMRAGIRMGDVIVKMNGKTVKDVEHFAELVADLPEDKNISVLVQRRSGPVFLALKIESKD